MLGLAPLYPSSGVSVSFVVLTVRSISHISRSRGRGVRERVVRAYVCSCDVIWSRVVFSSAPPFFVIVFYAQQKIPHDASRCPPSDAEYTQCKRVKEKG